MNEIIKIDSHQHFWQYDSAIHTWIDESMEVIQRDFLPLDLKNEMEKASYSYSIAVQADQTESETDFLLHLANQNDFIAGVVGWVDLRATNIEERLKFYAQFPKIKGFRHVVQSELDDNFLLQENFCKGIALLKDYNFTYDILIYPKHLPIANEFVKRFPEQKFVLDHLSKPFIKDKVIQPWKEEIQKLGKHKNLYCKLSGMVTEAAWKAWDFQDFMPYLDVVFETFGIDRLMIGSDWPVCKVSGEYGEVMQIVEHYLQKFSKAEQEKVLSKNAIHFYNLKIE